MYFLRFLQELLTSFADLALASDRISKRALIYVTSHNTFGAAALDILHRTTRRLNLKQKKLKIPKPVKVGHALKIIKGLRGMQLDQNFVKIVVRKKRVPRKDSGNVMDNIKRPSILSMSSKPKQVKMQMVKVEKPPPVVIPPGKWEDLNRQSKDYRINLLKSLLTQTQSQLVTVNTQMRFLVEDVFAGRFDEPDPHFLTSLAVMDKLIRKFIGSNQTTDAHLDKLIGVVKGLVEDTNGFVIHGHALIRKIVELRDMIQLAFRYLEDEYTLNIEGFIPSTVDMFTNSPEEKKSKCLCMKRDVSLKSSQFLHTEFRELLMVQSIKTKNPEAELILK